MFWMLLKSGGPGLLLFIRSLCKSIASETPVRVRFAPSPTGELHLGSLRTALFNYLFAKKYRGAFILRIENTDQTRLIADAEEKIEDTLSYFGLHLDESPLVGGNFGPYRQSERLLIYKDAAAKLLDSKHAYKCFCTQERLELLRKKALSEKSFPRYDLNCRKLSMSEINARERNGEVPVIRFKFDPGQMTFDDTVYGPYTHCWEETDFVIMKRDGYPTYHFASVVDDHLMQISSLSLGIHQYGHLPLITQDGKRKLSKRNNAAFVKYYIDMGYLPSAVLNFLLRNGSGIHNHDTHKLYSLEDMVYDFDERLMGKGTFMMHLRELDRYGRMAFQKANITSDILPVIKHQFSILSEEEKASLNPELLEEEYFRKVISFLKLSEETFSKLSDITTGDFHFFFMAPKTANKLLYHFPNIGRTLQMTKELIQLSRSGKMNFEELKMIATRESVPISDITKLIRLAVIDNISGPSIRELVDFFGREIENRLSQMMLLLENQSQREIKQL